RNDAPPSLIRCGVRPCKDETSLSCEAFTVVPLEPTDRPKRLVCHRTSRGIATKTIATARGTSVAAAAWRGRDVRRWSDGVSTGGLRDSRRSAAAAALPRDVDGNWHDARRRLPDPDARAGRAAVERVAGRRAPGAVRRRRPASATPVSEGRPRTAGARLACRLLRFSIVRMSRTNSPQRPAEGGYRHEARRWDSRHRPAVGVRGLARRRR